MVVVGAAGQAPCIPPHPPLLFLLVFCCVRPSPQTHNLKLPVVFVQAWPFLPASASNNQVLESARGRGRRAADVYDTSSMLSVLRYLHAGRAGPMRSALLVLALRVTRSTALYCPAQLTAEQLPVIHRDLLPWVDGIDTALFNSTVAYALNGVDNLETIGPCCSSVLVTISGGVVGTFYSRPDCNNTPAWPFVSALPRFLQGIAAGAQLPDTAFVFSMADKPDNDNTHRHFNVTRRPVFHFCRTADAADILVESHICHMDGEMGLHHLRAKLEERPPPAWADKQDILFGAWSEYGRWVYRDELATMRFGLDGEVNYDTRKTVQVLGQLMAANDSRVQINTN